MLEAPRHFRLGLLGAGAAARGVLPALLETGMVSMSFVADPAHAGERLAGQSVLADAPTPLVADFYILAVREPELPQLAANLAAQLKAEARPNCVVLQLSASSPLEALEPLRQCDARAGLLHPLQTFPAHTPPPEQIPFWALGGHPELRQILAPLLGRLADEWIWLEAQDQLPYHLSAVMASNFLPAMLSICGKLWPGSPEQAWRALHPILQQTLHNLELAPPERATSGPAARGDQATLALHRQWLEGHHPDLATVYDRLSSEITWLRTRKAEASPATASHTALGEEA